MNNENNYNDSSWEKLKAKSIYHFDKTVMDPRWDSVIPIGRFDGEWQDEVQWLIENSKESTWRNRQYGSDTNRGNANSDGNTPPSNWVHEEENDLIRAGAKPDMVICKMGYELPPKIQKMCDMIGLERGHDKAHVQMTGQVFNIHIDKLDTIYDEDPDDVMRIFIFLTDWEPGHFLGFGNYTHRWRAGDIITFDHVNCPHYTANAALVPRVSVVTTGVKSEKTCEFLKMAKSVPSIKI